MGGREGKKRGEKEGREGEREEGGKIRRAEERSRQVMLSKVQIRTRRGYNKNETTDEGEKVKERRRRKGIEEECKKNNKE